MTIIHEASFPEQGRMTIDLAILLGRECPMPIHGWAHEPMVQKRLSYEIVELGLFTIRHMDDAPLFPRTIWSTGGEP